MINFFDWTLFDYQYVTGEIFKVSIFKLPSFKPTDRALFEWTLFYEDDFNSIKHEQFSFLFMKFNGRKTYSFKNDDSSIKNKYDFDPKTDWKYYRCLKMFPILYMGWESDFKCWIIQHKKSKEKYILETSHGIYFMHQDVSRLDRFLNEYENVHQLTAEAKSIFIKEE